MRKCCFCVSVHTGAVVLGLIAVVLAALELSVLIPFLLEIQDFNPIQKHLKEFYFGLENVLEERNFTQEQRDEVILLVDSSLWPTFLFETVSAGVYLGSALLLLLGVGTKVRALMLPYMILQMVVVVSVVVSGILVTILLFFVSVIMGAICTGVTILTAFLFIYLWTVVQKSYIELGDNRDYMYSPAPLKPMYDPHSGNGGDYPYKPHHPSAPQRFHMS